MASASSSDDEPEELNLKGRRDDNSRSDDDHSGDGGVPFQDILRRLADGSAATSRASRNDRAPTRDKRKADAPLEGPKKRVHKSAPVEEKISRRPVAPMRDAVHIKGAHRRDPRFSSTAQTTDDASSRKRYAFLFDSQIPGELKALKAEMKAEKDERIKRRLQIRITRLQQSLKQEEDRRIAAEVEREWKGKERAAVAEGKSIYHLKKSEKKKLVLQKRFEKLQKDGKLEKYMAKRRKRNASKDRRKLPGRSAAS